MVRSELRDLKVDRNGRNVIRNKGLLWLLLDLYVAASQVKNRRAQPRLAVKAVKIGFRRVISFRLLLQLACVFASYLMYLTESSPRDLRHLYRFVAEAHDPVLPRLGTQLEENRLDGTSGAMRLNGVSTWAGVQA